MPPKSDKNVTLNSAVHSPCPLPLNVSLANAVDLGFVMSDDTDSVTGCVIGHGISGDVGLRSGLKSRTRMRS